MTGDRYAEQMQQLAEIGASCCTYAPGADDPEKWPTARCDCKFMPVGHDLLPGIHIGREQTGCAELRQAWRALDTLRARANG